MNFDVKALFFIGFYAFGIQVICNSILLVNNWFFHNFWSATATIMGLIFNIALTAFFKFSYHNMPSTSASGREADQETIDFIKELKRV